MPAERDYWADLLRRISRRTRGRADAEDLLHEAYVRFDRYRVNNEVRNPGNFLVQTAANIGIDIDRRSKLQTPVAFETFLQFKDRAPLQDEILAARARLARVKEGLERLTPRTRNIFLMHRLEGLKYGEIAARLGISQSAVEKHIAKAMLFLTNWTEGW